MRYFNFNKYFTSRIWYYVLGTTYNKTFKDVFYT